MKLLYNLEYEVAELRESLISQLEYKNLSLREVLDLGFNNTFINSIGMYKDENNEYIAKGYFIRDDELLNAEVEYIENEIKDDNFGNYLEIYCRFVDEKYNDLLNSVVNSVGDDKDDKERR
jgi:hypothetical protein